MIYFLAGKQFVANIMFNYYDRNSNQVLDEAELQDVEHRDHLEKLSRFCGLADMLTFDDKQEDGNITLSEFYSAFGKRCFSNPDMSNSLIICNFRGFSGLFNKEYTCNLLMRQHLLVQEIWMWPDPFTLIPADVNCCPIMVIWNKNFRGYMKVDWNVIPRLAIYIMVAELLMNATFRGSFVCNVMSFN